MSITEIAIKRPTLVVVIFTILGLAGWVSYTKLNYNLLPKFESPVMSIVTVYPGAGASEVEKAVTKPIEDAISGVENLKNINSTSQEGVSVVTVELNADANVNLAVEDAQRKINAKLSTLPDEVESPSINKFSTDDFPVMKLAITGNVPPTELYRLVDDQIAARFAKLNGVGQITVVGGTERQIRINLDMDKIRGQGLALNQVVAAIAGGNMEFPTGKIEGINSQYSIRLSGKYASLDEIRNLVVRRSTTGGLIKLQDIAEVEDGIADVATLNRLNGENSIGIQIRKQTDANAVEISELVKKEIAAIEKTYEHEKVKVVIANDSSVFTLSSAHAVMEDLGLAVILVAFVMFVFLHSLRNSFIVLVAIPASIVSVFVAMYVLNFSLNLMTLMGLSLVVGILVDDSIVVLENITRHLEMGKDKVTAALEGRSEIGFTAFAITLVDVVVFLPLSLVSGLIGNILREFSLVIVFSTLMSLFVSFTITPLLASRLGKVEHINGPGIMNKFSRGFERWFQGLVTTYEGILRWALTHKRYIILGVFALIISSFTLVGKGFIGSAFIKSGDRGEFIVKLEGAQTDNVYKSNQNALKAEQILRKYPEIERLFTNVGFSSSQLTSTATSYISEITVTLVPKTKRPMGVEEFGETVKAELASKLPGVKVTVTTVGITGQAEEAPIQVLIKGPTNEVITQAAKQIIPEVKKIPGTTDVKLSVEENKPELNVKLNRDKMSSLGFSVSDIGQSLQTAFAGNDDSKFRDGPNEYKINIELDKFDRESPQALASIPLVSTNGNVVELKQLADISQTLGTGKLQRSNRISSISVNCNVVGRAIGTVGNEIKASLDKKKLPEGVTIEYKGQMERTGDAFGSLGLAMLAGILLVYFVMVALYNSYSDPFVVLFSIPAAVIGALLALALAMDVLSIFSIIGMIMLIGLVAKNAILIVDFTNHLKEKGMNTFDALVEAGKERLRPILMTTVAMVVGMLPIALAKGDGAEAKNGMAWVIAGGLTSSLILTLVLVPAVYMSMEIMGAGISHNFRKLFGIKPKEKVHIKTAGAH